MNKNLYSRKQTMKYKRIVDSLSLDELIGQLMCVNVSASMTPERFEDYCQRRKPGALFIAHIPGEKVKSVLKIANKHSPVPVIVAADIENGPGMALSDQHLLPNCMAWGACDDPALMKTPVVRNGKQATVGFRPEIWETWEQH